MSRVRRIINRILVGAAVALLITYIADYAYFRLRSWHPKPADPLETLTVPRLFAIAEKGGKVDYQIDALNPEQTFTCVQSWFRTQVIHPAGTSNQKANNRSQCKGMRMPAHQFEVVIEKNQSRRRKVTSVYVPSVVPTGRNGKEKNAATSASMRAAPMPANNAMPARIPKMPLAADMMIQPV